MEDQSGTYVYCVIKADAPLELGAMGIGGRGDRVYSLHFRELAAVVSSCPLIVFDPTQENALAHEHVNEKVMKAFTVLPMSFGTVFRTEDDVRELLESMYETLSDTLRRIDGKIELGLKVNWDKDQITRDIGLENEEIRRLKEEIFSSTLTSTYYSRMQLGTVVESALQLKADAFVGEIHEALRGAVIAWRPGKPLNDRMIMNAAFLVERGKMKMFDDQLFEIARKYGNKLSFLRTGPWPPYNFVNIRLKLEPAQGP